MFQFLKHVSYIILYVACDFAALFYRKYLNNGEEGGGEKDRYTMYSPYYFIIMEYRMQHRKSFTTLRVKCISIIITNIIV